MNGRTSRLGRRSYLSLLGSTVALGAAGTASARSADDTGQQVSEDPGSSYPQPIFVDYGAYQTPGNVYDVNDVRGSHTPEFTTDRATQGDRSLRMTFTGGSKTANVEYRFADHLGEQLDEVYTRFSFYPENVALGANDTVRIFWAPLTNGTGSSGGGAASGTNGWSNAIGFANRNGSPAPEGYKFFSYRYDMDGSGQFEMTDAVVEMNAWNEIEAHVSVNGHDGGSASADGVMRYWVNGELAYENTGLRLTTSEANRIEGVGPLGYVIGNSSGSLYYDDHVIVPNADRQAAQERLDS